MSVLWRGFRLGYGGWRNYVHWRPRRWQSLGRERLSIGPVVISWPIQEQER